MNSGRKTIKMLYEKSFTITKALGNKERRDELKFERLQNLKLWMRLKKFYTADLTVEVFLLLTFKFQIQ